MFSFLVFAHPAISDTLFRRPKEKKPMMIRFVQESPDTTIIAREPLCACSWCGFQGGSLHKYSEEDGEKTLACEPCFTVRHAKSADKEMFGFAWIPEMPQTDIIHLTRVIALILSRHPKQRVAGRKDGFAQHQSAQNAKTLFDAIKKRVEETRSCVDIVDMLEKMEPQKTTLLLEGLRLVPLAFDVKDIEQWSKEGSSLSVYATDYLNRQSWFADDIGLGEEAVSILHQSEDFQDIAVYEVYRHRDRIQAGDPLEELKESANTEGKE